MAARKPVSDPDSTNGVSRPPRERGRRMGRWRVAAVALVGALLATGGAVVWARQALRGGKAEHVAARLPADVSFVVIGRGILEQALEFRTLLAAAQRWPPAISR